jgi:hypothetical protein
VIAVTGIKIKAKTRNLFRNPMYKHHSPHRTNPPNNEDPRAPQRRLLKHMAMRREAGHQLKMAAGSELIGRNSGWRRGQGVVRPSRKIKKTFYTRGVSQTALPIIMEGLKTIIHHGDLNVLGA